ncbi:type VI secretion protein [Alphaproteobacteria bacterium]|nr:type VI secretion protein [Alphaproteobacteria bacterium]GHS96387.1 type VI secretion protein [Alphaproteobacteria bacterium]
MAEGTQHKLSRVRPPRVQITYDVEIGNAIEMKELPFVLGIMADLSGMPENPLPKLKERKFVELDRDNFNDILASIAPRLVLRVPNTVLKDGSETNVELRFSSMDDFSPLQVVKNVPTLAKFYEIRSHLKDLLTKLDGNDDLEECLKKIMTDSAEKDAIKGALPPLEGEGEAKEGAASESKEGEAHG